MFYESPVAFRMALEQRLRNDSERSGVGHDRLRRQIVFERVAIRLDLAEPGCWVLKGGLALDLRLGADARATRDLDLGLRHRDIEADALRDRLIEALASDPDEDWFTFAVGAVEVLGGDEAGRHTMRYAVRASLAGRTFGGIKLDVSPRPEELLWTERLPLHNVLAFAGTPSRDIEIIDVNRHAAEKVHALTRDYGDHQNTRTRDLVDLVLLLEYDQLDDRACSLAVRETFTQRATHDVPMHLPDPPPAWVDTYERLASELDMGIRTVGEAMVLLREWWSRLGLSDR